MRLALSQSFLCLVAGFQKPLQKSSVTCCRITSVPLCLLLALQLPSKDGHFLPSPPAPEVRSASHRSPTLNPCFEGILGPTTWGSLGATKWRKSGQRPPRPIDGNLSNGQTEGMRQTSSSGFYEDIDAPGLTASVNVRWYCGDGEDIKNGHLFWATIYISTEGEEKRQNGL